MKATILRARSIGLSLTHGLVASGVCKKQDIILTKRNSKDLNELQKKGIKLSSAIVNNLFKAS
jgi:hypothetical protein